MKIYDLPQQACDFYQGNDRFRNFAFTAIYNIYLESIYVVLFDTQRYFSLHECVF